MSDVVIHAENLGKLYHIGERGHYHTLRDKLAGAMSNPARFFHPRNPASSNGAPSTIWALKGVSFDIRQGEVVGIIGRNGAGKTTLLKILSRVAKPTVGTAGIRGRMGSLLEVGTGFHPELTGRDNVFLSGAILGMKKAEIERKFDEIVAFSEVEKFIDTPLKHYSSGMHMRLAFAVAAHLDPDILLVDEVLAVGDAAFQRKCLGKMGDVAREGRTILFVSHNMGALTRLCPRSIWLEAGAVLRDGDSIQLAAEYFARQSTTRTEWRRPPHLRKGEDLHFSRARILGPDGEPQSVFASNEAVTVELHYVIERPLVGCEVGSRITNMEGVVVLSSVEADTADCSRRREPGAYTAKYQIPPHLLAPGVYMLSCGSHLPGQKRYDSLEHILTFEISLVGSTLNRPGRPGVIHPIFPWETTQDSLAEPVATE